MFRCAAPSPRVRRMHRPCNIRRNSAHKFSLEVTAVMMPVKVTPAIAESDDFQAVLHEPEIQGNKVEEEIGNSVLFYDIALPDFLQINHVRLPVTSEQLSFYRDQLTATEPLNGL